jgi:hypothetical protein
VVPRLNARGLIFLGGQWPAGLIREIDVREYDQAWSRHSASNKWSGASPLTLPNGLRVGQPVDVTLLSEPLPASQASR